MRKSALWRIAAVLASVACSVGLARAESGGGPINIDVHDNASAEIEAIHPEMTRRAAALGVPVASRAGPGGRAGTLFQYPLRSTQLVPGFLADAVSFYVDHAPAGAVQDFACGTRAYDGHTGTDLVAVPYGWNAMDRLELRVVAAQGGVLIEKQDGQFDRQCSAGGQPANYVIVRHDNGFLGYYWHLKNGTVTTKTVGSRVALGEHLGYVGSSGSSTAPHLHFEVRDGAGNLIDPFGGACDAGVQWSHQALPANTAVVRLATHSTAPPSPGQCADPNPNYAIGFLRGSQVFGVIYFREQTPGATAVVEFVRPNGSVASSFTTGAPASGVWASSFWWSSFTVPSDAPIGQWWLRATFAGRVHEEAFWVGRTSLPRTTITLSIDSPQRTVTAGTPALFTVRVRNTGTTREAVGCRLSIARPILADYVFWAAGAPSGAVNRVFRVSPNSTKTVTLRITPQSGFFARSAEFSVHAKCANTIAAPFSRAGTMLTLTGG